MNNICNMLLETGYINVLKEKKEKEKREAARQQNCLYLSARTTSR